MNAITAKAEAALLIPTPPSRREEEIEAIRLSAIRARDEATLGTIGRVARRAAAAVAELVETVATWPRRQQTYENLARLTDRELADIGLTRGDIARVFDEDFARGANDNAPRRAA